MLTLSLALLASSGPPTNSPVGIWEGHVANLPVRACFDETSSGVFGAYYYQSTKQLIPLEAEPGQARIFRERSEDEGQGPSWRIDEIGSEGLRGTWTNRRRMLPVRLSRVAVRGDLEPCQHIEFHRPRLEGITVSDRPGTIDNVPIRWLKLDSRGRFQASVESFSIDAPGAATDRINQALEESFAGHPPEWFECVRSPLDRAPNEGDFHRQTVPAMITERWLSVIDRLDAYCGGAHPGGGERYRLFDRASGAEVDLRDWFGPAAIIPEAREEGMADDLTPAFRDFLLSDWTSDAAECEEPVRTSGSWTIGLTRTGMVFAPDLPHVVRACGESFAVPFERLRPFMTSEGLAAISELDSTR